jgi:hypothetical protein
MKKSILYIILSFAIISTFTACNDDDPTAKPEIKILELGEGSSHGNDHTAYIGGELHIEVEVVAQGKIDKIQVRLHPEGEHHGESGDHDEWELDKTFTKFSGLKNTTFHEHIDIATTAEPGEYHFDFIVTDMEGNQSSAEADVILKAKN